MFLGVVQTTRCIIFRSAGLPGRLPIEVRHERFWYVVITIGQLYHRMIKPYRQFPLRLGQVVDPSMTEMRRLQVAGEFCSLNSCCVDKLFSEPILKEAHLRGGAEALTKGPLASDLAVALRGKTSNVELELNFARASSSRSINHGRGHNIAAMCAKHITAEIKLGQRRVLSKQNVDTKKAGLKRFLFPNLAHST